MHNIELALGGAWKVLLVGLLLGAGLPILFAAGIKLMAVGAGGSAETTAAAPNPVGKVAGIAVFVIVVAVVLLGVAFIVASGLGKTISFEYIFPIFVDK